MLIEATLKDPQNGAPLYQRVAGVSAWEHTFSRWIAFLPEKEARRVLAMLGETLGHSLPDPEVVDENEFTDALAEWREAWQPHVSNAYHSNPLEAVRLYCEGWCTPSVFVADSGSHEWEPQSSYARDLSRKIFREVSSHPDGISIIMSLPSPKDFFGYDNELSTVRSPSLTPDSTPQLEYPHSYSPYSESAAFVLKTLVLERIPEVKRFPLSVVAASLYSTMRELGEDSANSGDMF